MANYNTVNSLWPEGTNDGRTIKPTPEEAVRAARRLYRFAFKKKWHGRIKLTSGRRYSYIRWGTMYVNPDWNGHGGWHELVHMLSHSFCSHMYPSAKGHGPQHAWLEKEMTAYVVKSGWLDGKLRPKTKQPKPDLKQTRYQSTLASIKAWTTKKKRAETALRKLHLRRKYYERQMAAQ